LAKKSSTQSCYSSPTLTSAVIAINGVQKTGLFLCNQDIFDEFLENIHLNLASHAFDNPLPDMSMHGDVSVCNKGSEFVSSDIIISTPFT
jgi:hypothetical protein